VRTGTSVSRWTAAAAAVMLVLSLGACGGGEDDVDGAAANKKLEQQRTDVRDAARALLTGTEQTLPGKTSSSIGRYRGCESAFNDEFKNFRYLAQAKVDVDAVAHAPEPYLEELRPVLEEAGFEVDDDVVESANGFVSLKGRKGDVSAQFVYTGAGPFVALDVAGPCVDVPEDERDGWLRKDEPTPSLL
jgi:hypothetical protein